MLLAGCSSSPAVKLADINPNRTYNEEYKQVLEAVRTYLTLEGFTLDRFETEYGTIIAHRTEPRTLQEPVTDDSIHVIVLRMSIKRESARRTNVNASFSFGGVHAARTADDEAVLVLHYSRVFEYLDSVLARQR
jgi:hypothetical protein